MIKKYYDKDCDLSLFEGKTVEDIVVSEEDLY